MATEQDLRDIAHFTRFVQKLFGLRALPIDDLALALGDELFLREEARESDLAIAYQVAIILRYWHEMNPEWRLPELSAELGDLAKGRRSFPLARPADYGYEPQPGRITLSTQHSAKGLEWDTVYLLGIDGVWIPGDLDAPFIGVDDTLGGDPIAEALTQLRQLMEGESGLYQGLTATESAHVDVICERLRLFYVAITRARRFLYISRSRAKGRTRVDQGSLPATVLGLLYEYLQQQREREA